MGSPFYLKTLGLIYGHAVVGMQSCRQNVYIRHSIQITFPIAIKVPSRIGNDDDLRFPSVKVTVSLPLSTQPVDQMKVFSYPNEVIYN